MSQRSVVRKLGKTAAAVLLAVGGVLGAAPVPPVAPPLADPLIERFKKVYETRIGIYHQFFTRRVNGKPFLFAYWLKDGSAVDLWVDIFDVSWLESRGEVYKVYSGSVAEEVVDIVLTDVDGDGKDEVIFMSRSGQIKVVYILKDTGREFAQIYEGGSKDIILYRDGPLFKMIFRVESGEKVIFYRWDKAGKTFVIEKQGKLLH